MYLKDLHFLQPVILRFSYDPTGNFVLINKFYKVMKEEIQVTPECP